PANSNLHSFPTRRSSDLRAERMKFHSDNCYLLSETNTQQIFQQIEALQPQLLVIDSIQTLHSKHVESAAGSVSQVRECTAEIMKDRKSTRLNSSHVKISY